ncbi:MAG: chemotaxis protein CheD [Nitrospiraceae bacterium]|nr:chemotaxis protein CheD [Nitrospiraceae bacterium]
MNYTIGISEIQISNRPEDVLITYSLGSCVGLTLYDPVARAGGMIHCMLPLSKIDPDKAKANPFMFTDTGVPALIQEVLSMGGLMKRLVAKVAGGASLLDQQGTFKIGERNYIVLRKVLWKNNILIAAEDTGGTKARTMSLYMDTGKTYIKSLGQLTELA